MNKKCGNCRVCDAYALNYDESSKNKKKKLELLFSGYQVSDFIKADNPYHYRHKVIASFKYQNRRVVAGIYEENSHNVLDSSQCLIQDEIANKIIKSIVQLANKYRMEVYDEDRRKGLLRHVLIRTSQYTNEVLVCLILATDKFASRKNFVKKLVELNPEITTVTQSINNRRTSIVLGDKEKTIYGPGFIYDYLNGLKFKISSKSFYQINPVQTEKLYDIAINFADLKADDVVLDAYSGIGTIGMIASKRGISKVYSVELNKISSIMAKSNARINNIDNIEIINADATKYILKLADQKVKVDVVILDPTRSGTTVEFIQAVAKLKPKQVIYVSCNPETQLRDLKYFEKNYKVKTIVGVDLFPFTKHVETVVLMSRK